MLDKSMFDEMMLKFVLEMKRVFADSLVQIILFGSYAMGNQQEDSDVDVMVLVNIDKVKIKEYREKVVDVVCSLNSEYDVLLSPLVQNYEEFERFKEASGFFKNVDRQGVKISA